MDPDALVASRLRAIAEGAGFSVDTHPGFETARQVLRSRGAPSALIVNVRLGEFNGIHLVYLAKLSGGADLRALVYARLHDLTLARDAQRAGAFYQRQGLLQFSLGIFLTVGLPAADRRDVSCVDRRASFRGGRRATDLASLHFALGAI